MRRAVERDGLRRVAELECVFVVAGVLDLIGEAAELTLLWVKLPLADEKSSAARDSGAMPAHKTAMVVSEMVVDFIELFWVVNGSTSRGKQE